MAKRWLVCYHLYGWGFPLLVGTVALVMDDNLADRHPLKPDFLQYNCWFQVNNYSKSLTLMCHSSSKLLNLKPQPFLSNATQYNDSVQLRP